MSIVAIPGMPGEFIDSSVLPQVEAIIHKYRAKVTDGYSRDPVHAAGGDHPKGLGVDIVPDTRRGGTWDDIDKLIHRVEPQQNHVAKGFRWVGYNGDANHGRGNHAHIGFIPGERKSALKAIGGGGGVGDVVDGVVDGVKGGASAVASDVAGATANAVLDLLWKAVGKDGLRGLLYVALVGGGALLVVLGARRTVGA